MGIDMKPASARVLVLVAMLVIAAPLIAAPQARAQVQPLVADLSDHLVAITTGFAGTEVLMFGATDGPGDVIMVVRGPVGESLVRRKDRISGIWVNADQMRFSNVPAYYRVFSSRPLEEFAPERVLDRHQIGLDNLDFISEAEGRAVQDDNFRDALLRLKQSEGLYGTGTGDITVLGNRLFRADVAFPANVPVGTYAVEIYLLRRGEVVSAEITPLVISKIGVGAELFEFAHRQSALYGLGAILVAALAGWLAGIAFRKT